MIVVNPMSGQTKIKVTGLYQWDKLQTLQFADEYPRGTEVHFATKGETVAMVYLLENGSVRIPNVLLQRALPIMAWVHVGEATVLEIEMPVTARAMPSDYIGIEDDVQHSIEYRMIQLEQWQVEAIEQMSDRYTKAETDQKLNLKADANRVYTKLETNTLLNEKADSSELAEKASVEDVALKADKTYVDTKDALKADKTYVDTQDGLKADKTYVDDKLSEKADKTYVDTQDGLKADIAYVDTQDALKADKTYVDTQDGLKADKTYVDDKLSEKADIGLLEASLSDNKIYQTLKDSSDDTLLDSSGNLIEGTVIFVNAQEAYDLKTRINTLETLIMSIFSEISPNQISVLFGMVGAINENVSLLENHAILDSDY